MIIIVGAGSHGLSLAYHLYKEGIKDVSIIEAKNVGYGSSSRNASRYRYHFNSKENIEFAKSAIPYLWSQYKELILNVFMFNTGYLWILRTDEEIRTINKLDSIWREEGISGKFIRCNEFEFLKFDGECYFAPQNGSFHHDYLLYSYYLKIKDKYQFIYREADKIIIENSRVKGVKLSTGEVVNGDTVVITAGAWSGELMKKNNFNVPIFPEKKEIFITESLRYMVKPLVIDETNQVYFSHTLKGEIIGGTSTPHEYGFYEFSNSIQELSKFLRGVRSLVKGAEGIGIMRGWSGYYEMTPDNSHIMGFSNEWPEGLYIDAGYSGHGMMFSPYSGKILSKLILDGYVDNQITRFSPDRFKEGKLIGEKLVI
ncbi:FAD-dependent oxidoreductase [Sulfolobus acidocaldarius SUSAZ]|nr:FAD-dependent oxidoreductase [Sulfolobus acidocaldarius SUSAZ]